MITPVLYAGEKGKDVLTDNARFRTLDSTRNQFKVFASGVETFSLNSGNSYSYTKTVTHNLGYVPLALCYAYFAEPNEAFDDIVKVEKFTLLPYGFIMGTDPLTASLVATLERTTAYVKFKFFQQTDWYEYTPAPANFTLTDMKMKYLVYIDQE
jgi:hypothetical protein